MNGMLPPRRPEELNNQQDGLPPIQYGYASEILPHIQAALGGLFSGEQQKSPEVTQQQQAANDAIWARLGQGKAATPSSVGPEMPMQARRQHMSNPAFENPFLAYSMPGMNAPQNMAQYSPLQQAQQPQQPQVAGLLGGPNDASTRAFLNSQLYGNKPPVAPINTVGGSATQATNPFLYAQLYGRRGG